MCLPPLRLGPRGEFSSRRHQLSWGLWEKPISRSPQAPTDPGVERELQQVLLSSASSPATAPSRTSAPLWFRLPRDFHAHEVVCCAIDLAAHRRQPLRKVCCQLRATVAAFRASTAFAVYRLIPAVCYSAWAIVDCCIVPAWQHCLDDPRIHFASLPIPHRWSPTR